MNITWTTLQQSPNPTVMYGTVEGQLTLTATGSSHTFDHGGWRGYVRKLSYDNRDEEV